MTTREEIDRKLIAVGLDPIERRIYHYVYSNTLNGKICQTGDEPMAEAIGTSPDMLRRIKKRMCDPEYYPLMCGTPLLSSRKGPRNVNILEIVVFDD